MIRDVAHRAGVSVGTVSRVINGHPSVGAALRNRVLIVIEELGYRPNVLAQSLRGVSSRAIGLIIPDVTNPFFAELVKHVEQAAHARGVSVILGNSGNDQAMEAVYVDTLLARQVDGLIIATSLRTQLRSRPAGPPMVLIDRALAGFRTVMSDHRQGARDAARYLVQIGHSRIGCITGPQSLAVSAARLAGFVEGAESALVQAAIHVATFDYQGGYNAARTILRLRPNVTAIIASSDQQAIGAMRAAWDAGLVLPRDLSVIGYDDIPQAAFSVPRLTTISQDVASLGDQAMSLLKENRGEAVRLVPTVLKHRDSCAAPGEGGGGEKPGRGI